MDAGSDDEEEEEEEVPRVSDHMFFALLSREQACVLLPLLSSPFVSFYFLPFLL